MPVFHTAVGARRAVERQEASTGGIPPTHPSIHHLGCTYTVGRRGSTNTAERQDDVGYFQLFTRKVILVGLQLIPHSRQPIVYILRRTFKEGWVR